MKLKEKIRGMKKWQKITSAIVGIILIGSIASEEPTTVENEDNSTSTMSQEETTEEPEETTEEVENAPTEKESYTSSSNSNTSNLSERNSDKLALAKYGTLVMDFISKCSDEISKHALNNDPMSVMAYAKGVVIEFEKGEITNSFNSAKLSFKTDEGLALYNETISLFNDYMVIINNLSKGDFSEGSIGMMGKISEDIIIIKDKIVNF